MSTEDAEVNDAIERYIHHVRTMATMTDDQLRMVLKQAARDNPAMFDTFKQSARKKALLDMKKLAKDIGGDPKKFARRVDDIRF